MQGKMEQWTNEGCACREKCTERWTLVGFDRPNCIEGWMEGMMDRGKDRTDALKAGIRDKTCRWRWRKETLEMWEGDQVPVEIQRQETAREKESNEGNNDTEKGEAEIQREKQRQRDRGRHRETQRYTEGDREREKERERRLDID